MDVMVDCQRKEGHSEWHSRSGSRRCDPTCDRACLRGRHLSEKHQPFLVADAPVAVESHERKWSDKKRLWSRCPIFISSPTFFCRAQDLLILFDDEPALVRPAELAEMVREMLTEPHWNCAADPSIVPTAHRAKLPAQNGLRRTG